VTDDEKNTHEKKGARRTLASLKREGVLKGGNVGGSGQGDRFKLGMSGTRGEKVNVGQARGNEGWNAPLERASR